MNDENSKIEKLLAQAHCEEEEKTSVSEAERKLKDASGAEEIYRRLCAKLLHIERWNYESVAMKFALFSKRGEEIPEKTAAVGDFIRIALPGTGKFDWVKIIKIDETATETILTVQPTFDPTQNSPDKSKTSHFFTAESTNNFCLLLDETTIKMYVIGLNEVTNTEEASGMIESVRNLATANLGHYLGVQKAAWTAFCVNFLEKEKTD